MATPHSVDAGEFRARQRQQWDSAAYGWRRWSDTIDAGGRELNERMVELAGVERGSRVLDVAAGAGEPALTAAAEVGEAGAVVATDISADMLAIADERATEAGLDNVEFVESAAAALEFPEDSFDSALSRFGIIFEPDAEDAAARVRQVLKPGRRLAISSWGAPDQVPVISVPMQAVSERLGLEPPPPGTPGPLARPTPGALCGLLEAGGFSDLEAEEAEVSLEWPSPEAFTTFVRETLPPVHAMLAGQPPAEQEEAWEAITEAVREAVPQGADSVRLSNLALLASGRA